MVTATESAKRCRVCSELRPIHEFRRRYRDGNTRFSECRGCHNRRERLRLARKKTEQDFQQIAVFAGKLKDLRRDASVANLCEKMIVHFGGPERFASKWHEQFQAAVAHRPGSRRVLDCLLALVRIMQFCESNRPRKEDAEALSDDQLEAIVMWYGQQFIQQAPEVAVEAARSLDLDSSSL